MKTQITIEVEINLLRKARQLAADDGVTVEALLAKQLRQIVRKHSEYDHARKRALARLRKGTDLRWAPARSRDELHDRILNRTSTSDPLIDS